MSEAVCGPSNPLQQFKQQTKIDRTLQQDHLATRHSHAQGFRSHDPNGALLDAEFEAFQAGASVPELPHFHPQHEQQMFKPAPFAGTSQPPPWATDFQRLNITSPVPVQHQHINPQPGTVNWAQDFQQHITQSAPRAQSSSPSPWAFQQRARYGGNGGFQSSFASQNFAESTQLKGKAPLRERFDDEAFDRAFDMLAEENLQEDVVNDEIMDDTQNLDSVMEETIEQALKESMLDPETVLGNVANDEPHSLTAAEDMDYNGAGLVENLNTHNQQEAHKEPQQNSRQEDDALAHAAEELLDRVKDDKSDKFQNSQFMALMRKLKDREVRVDGDKMVETVGVTSASYVPKRDLSPDSGYGSDPSTPIMQAVEHEVFESEYDHFDFNSHDLMDEHRWDHWESPYT